MDKRLYPEIDEKVQDTDLKSIAHSNHEFSSLPPCFSCSASDCDAVNCVKLEIWFNRTRKMY